MADNGKTVFADWYPFWGSLDSNIVGEEPTWRQKTQELEAPKNNDGRTHCYWCGAKTERKTGFMYNSFYDVCTNPKCRR